MEGDIWLPNGGGEGRPAINRMHPSVMGMLSDDPRLEVVIREIEDGLPRSAQQEDDTSSDEFQSLISLVRTKVGKVPFDMLAEEITTDTGDLFTPEQIALAIRTVGFR